MPICPHCKQVVSDEENFCNECGSPVTKDQTDGNGTAQQNITTNMASLVLPDNVELEIDEAQRLVGRVDLAKYSKLDPTKISRGHFTVYEKDGKYYIEDGNTNVQNKASDEHTLLNDDDITNKKKVELSNGDVIKVLDVAITVKLWEYD